jgi:FixJ family two-component response regulator
MPAANSTVLVVDDDPAPRNSVARLLRSVGLDAQLFASISEFLKGARIMIQVVRGHLRKRIAADIGIAGSHGGGPPQQSNAQDERAFTSRARSNGRQAQAGN